MMRRLFLLLFLLAGCAMGGISLDKLPPHPRLFANAARFDEIKRQVADEGPARDFFLLLKARADALLKQEPVERVLTGRRLLPVSRQALECITISAMVGRLEGNAEYKRRAITEMRALAGFTDWNQPHFLDVAEATFAMGIGYDWLYDDLTPEDRDLISGAIIGKGLEASLASRSGKPPFWVAGTNNWNQVCHSGMTIGALAVAERNPELAARMVDRAIENLKHSAKAYAPDGIYPEGPGYWAYGTGFHVALVDALKTALGDTFGLEKFPGFLKTADFIVQMHSPAGRYYNFSDNVQTRGFETPLFWFARELKRPGLLEADLALVQDLKAKPRKLDRLMALALVWWDGKEAGTEENPPTSWTGDGKVPLAVFRERWGDRNAAFVAFKGGRPDISHGHMDVGSFVFERDGIRWAEDPGLQSYNTLESRGIDLWNQKQDSPRWKVFRLGSEAHNIPRFDGADQRVEGSAVVVKSSAEKRLMVLDLTALHGGAVKSSQRGLRMLADGGVVIRDEWQTEEKPVSMAFQWLTRAKVAADQSGAVLESGGKSLRLEVEASSPFTIGVQDLSKPVNDYDEANPGLKRIVITTKTDAGSTGTMTVTAGVKEKSTASRNLDSW
ncbi:heparinase II/III family protein [Luteolibacter sp. SL250]|uniref:heparinase II/III domain-containing protein n=1 Tax=Luteolibacter sp. SL250 TaxID=2995170 RepID=UPI00226D682B|nr:heparinase II/III family protein [Luteolibacter sp. SL250]WAC20425.1 heparinase II/III family protein [Luteolibacter sp. SL250]